MPAAIHVRGLRELSVAFAAAGKQAQRELRISLAEVAVPIQRDAEQLAATRITRIGPKWSAMRIGVTQRLVYVAPKKRGIKGRVGDPLRRPKFAHLLAERAMEPALARNEHRIEAAAEAVIANVGRKWEKR